MTDFTQSISDSVGITDSLARGIVFARSCSDTVGITDAIVGRTRNHKALADAVGITDVLFKIYRFVLADAVGITGTLSTDSGLIAYDSWRPVPKPDNSLVLLCRTPAGSHDSLDALEDLRLWTIHPDGTQETPVVGDVSENGYGWIRYGHPEWSPDGTQVVVWAETADEFQLILLESSGFGQS